MFLVFCLVASLLPIAITNQYKNRLYLIPTDQMAISLKLIQKPEFLLRVGQNKNKDVDTFVKSLRSVIEDQTVTLRYLNANNDLNNGKYYF